MTKLVEKWQMAYEKFWRELSLAGDPERIPNKVLAGYKRGWEDALASHAPSPSSDICEKCGQKVIDGHWSLVCHKPACIKALQEGEVSMSYDLPIKRCFNLEDHSEHSWEYKNELHKCPGMPIQPSEAAAKSIGRNGAAFDMSQQVQPEPSEVIGEAAANAGTNQ